MLHPLRIRSNVAPHPILLYFRRSLSECLISSGSGIHLSFPQVTAGRFSGIINRFSYE